MKNNIKVGTRYRATNSKGDVAEIWLNRQEPGLEMWMWSFCHKDGSGHDQDWGPTYRTCRDEVSWKMGEKVRFKLVSE